ncbi:MAG TPA: FkbM family methyltransferase, partial [Roseivirga sp.]
LRWNYLDVFLYPWRNKYNWREVEVFYDDERDLRYVLSENKKLYFKRSWDEERIKKAYNFLRIEQDQDSPHRYLTEDFQFKSQGILADIGAAEGNFSLQVVNSASFIHLFEMDHEWVEALQATFAPWSQKVRIINAFVANSESDNQIKLDTYFEGQARPDFIKIDVEGSELSVLEGANSIIKDAHDDLKIALCTYHRQTDSSTFKKYLEKVNFKVSFSQGLMIYLNDPKLAPPYFRKGLIRASKQIDF